MKTRKIKSSWDGNHKHAWERLLNLNSAEIKKDHWEKNLRGDERPREKEKEEEGVRGRVREEAGETEQAESRKPKRASAHKMRKWSGSWEARPPNLSPCWRTPHYCTSWALAVAFEVLWGTSSHETSIVNPLVNQVRSWAYVWSGSFSSEGSKRSKEIVAGCKDGVPNI